MNNFALSGSIHVSLPAEELFKLGPISFTNSMVLGLVAYLLLIWMFWSVARNIATGKTNRFTTLIHWIFEGLLTTVEQAVGDKQKARKIAPLSITIFFFVVVNYWIGILPIVGPIEYHGVPLFRGPATDLNVTFALAIITMVAVQIFAIMTHGFFGNAKRYFINPFKDPAHAFEGILELVAEFSRLMALSLRLFGNVFAGEILVAVIAFLSGWVTPISQPFFLAFELFIGIVQAYVFFMLSVVFISLGTSSHDEHSADHDAAETDRPAGIDAEAVKA